MRKMGELFGGFVSLTVDTYDFLQGVKNAITVMKELKEKGKKVAGIFIDSGDLVDRSKIARKMLDDAGFRDATITVATNLDEYKIKKLKEEGIKADIFIIATEITSVSDSPKLETVYKLTEIDKLDKILYCAKFSPGKESYPGKKQVFRIKKGGKFKKDIIGLDNESLGEEQLVDIFKKGKLVYKRKSLDDIKNYVANQIAQIPQNLLSIDRDIKYEVLLSDKLKELFEDVRKGHS